MEQILIKTPEQIKNIRESGKYLTELLHQLYARSKPGVSLIELEQYAQSFMDKNKVVWAFKWYQWFPANLCTSIDSCVVHGIPDKYELKPWDLLKVDCGIIYNKWISDSAFSIVIGWDDTNPQAAALVKATKWALDNWLQYIKPGKKIFDFSNSITEYMTMNDFSVIMPLTGHGVGTTLHEAPYIFNYGHPDTKKTQRKPWMIVALEPITSIKSSAYVEDKKNWRNLYTSKWDLWAQREYMILITSNGYEILSGITEL